MYMQAAPTAVPARPPFWIRLSVPVGNGIQLLGIGGGAILLFIAAHTQRADSLRILLMLLGWLAIYVCSHAIGHWTGGRLVGIRFRGYGVRGSDHPQDYPPGFRQLIAGLPMFTALTNKSSMQQATPLARALMFGAGESSTTLCTLLVGWYAWWSGIPGGGILLVAMIVFNILVTITTAIVPRGDYAKARHALNARQ